MAKAKCDECLKQIRTLHDLVHREFSDADFLCNDCEKYLCSTCITEHEEHLTFALKGKSNKTKLDRFSEEIIKELTSEGDQTLEKFTQERTHLCDIVDVVGEDVVGEEMRPPPSGRTNVDFSVSDICILRESKQWAITDCFNNCVKVFNINNNQMTRTIHLKYQPYCITEIPSTYPSQSLIAVSYPHEKIVDVMNINSEPAQVISSIRVHDECYELAHCNNKLITRCRDFRTRACHESIHVMGMTGEIINVIDLDKHPDFKVGWFSTIYMYIHSESETIYVCHFRDPACLISLSLDGKVLHSVKFTDINPRCVCVDIYQTVYVTGHNVPLYKLSSDLSHIDKVIDERLLKRWFSDRYYYTDIRIACHADTFYIVRSDGRAFIFRHE